MLTLFGASVLTFMMLMYAFERGHRLFILAFAVFCALSSAYGFLSGTWPLGVVELVWVLIALRRYFGYGRSIADGSTVRVRPARPRCGRAGAFC